MSVGGSLFFCFATEGVVEGGTPEMERHIRTSWYANEAAGGFICIPAPRMQMSRVSLPSVFVCCLVLLLDSTRPISSRRSTSIDSRRTVWSTLDRYWITLAFDGMAMFFVGFIISASISICKWADAIDDVQCYRRRIKWLRSLESYLVLLGFLFHGRLRVSSGSHPGLPSFTGFYLVLLGY